MATEKRYLDRENTVDLILLADGVAVDLAAVTSIKAVFNTVEIISTDKGAGLIKWDQGGWDTGEIRLDCAADSDLVSQGDGTWDVPIVVIDPSNPTGIDWGSVRIEVIEQRGT